MKVSGYDEIATIEDVTFERHMVVGVCSFANTGDCTSTPGGFARLTLSVLQWIRSVKVKQMIINIEL